MGNRQFKEGTIIKGKKLKGSILCKVLKEDMKMRGYQYQMGMNEDVNPLVLEGHCEAGLHFCIITNICDYLDYGTKLAIVSIPDNEDVYVDNGKFRTHRLSIDRIMPFCQTTTWKYLYKNGADITAYDNYAVRLAARNGYLEIVKYLHENGADITAYDNYAVRQASKNGHLEVVKYLHENGADITAYHNYAIIGAATNGHLNVVKYLHKNGADITAQNNSAVRCAAGNGYLEVVKYLHKNRADITAYDNYAVIWAARNGHLEVVKYLHENGADITADGNYAVICAAKNSRTDVVEYLRAKSLLANGWWIYYRIHSLLKMFLNLNAHSGFNREDLQGYLDLYAFVINPPSDYLEKVEKLIKMVFENPELLRYRDQFG